MSGLRGWCAGTQTHPEHDETLVDAAYAGRQGSPFGKLRDPDEQPRMERSGSLELVFVFVRVHVGPLVDVLVV